MPKTAEIGHNVDGIANRWCCAKCLLFVKVVSRGCYA